VIGVGGMTHPQEKTDHQNGEPAGHYFFTSLQSEGYLRSCNFA
jgi:hypothetical protein